MNEVENNITSVILDLVKKYVEELNNMPISHGPNIISNKNNKMSYFNTPNP